MHLFRPAAKSATPTAPAPPPQNSTEACHLPLPSSAQEPLLHSRLWLHSTSHLFLSPLRCLLLCSALLFGLAGAGALNRMFVSTFSGVKEVAERIIVAISSGTAFQHKLIFHSFSFPVRLFLLSRSLINSPRTLSLSFPVADAIDLSYLLHFRSIPILQAIRWQGLHLSP